jgi:hypothetical protein
MCVSPCDMQPKFLAVQRQEVGAKFSPTWKVERDVDQNITWGIAPLGKWVRREVPHALLLLLLARLDSARHDTSRRARRAAVCRIAELSLGAELIFLLHRKTERLTESLTDASQLAGSGRSRIMGCCNRLGRATWTWPMLPRVSPLCAYINSCPATAAHTWNGSRVLPPLATCATSVVYSILNAGVHRRTGEQVSGTTRLCDPIREMAN